MLIDSKSLIDRYCRTRCGHHATVCIKACDMVKFIWQEPEAVVRCAECKRYDVGQNESDAWAFCTWFQREMEPDEFCDFGERRADDA